MGQPNSVASRIKAKFSACGETRCPAGIGGGRKNATPQACNNLTEEPPHSNLMSSAHFPTSPEPAVISDNESDEAQGDESTGSALEATLPIPTGRQAADYIYVSGDTI